MTRAPKILVVDDNVDNVELLTKRLHALGYETCEAYDGEEALARVEQDRPDLVILDVMMPKLDGFQVCQRLKGSERTRLIPVIMLTAKREVPDKIRGLDTGADDYVTKPFNPQELMARVRSLLNLRTVQDRRATEEKLGALGQMAEGVAHEVRNPMVAIGGFARRIRDRLEEGDPLREYAEHIIKETQRLESMVEEIVRFKTLLISPYEPVAPQALVDGVLDAWKDTFARAGVAVDRAYGPDVPVIEGDPANLKLALGNLLQNALEATVTGGTVTVTVSGGADHVTFQVADTGRGIPRDELPNVFDPFYTSKMSGAGLGLTTVHRIVSRHGGEVGIESVEGEGTVVTIRLPVHQDQAQA